MIDKKAIHQPRRIGRLRGMGCPWKFSSCGKKERRFGRPIPQAPYRVISCCRHRGWVVSSPHASPALKLSHLPTRQRRGGFGLLAEGMQNIPGIWAQFGCCAVLTFFKNRRPRPVAVLTPESTRHYLGCLLYYL